METNDIPELVQDSSTNNLHIRGADKADGTATALCNRRYRVFTYTSDEAQADLASVWVKWEHYRCSRCETKAAQR